MRLIYIAAPFRGKDHWDVERNIRRAEELMWEVNQIPGVMGVCPQAMTRFFDGTFTDEYWLEGTMELMRRCDAVIFAPRWILSDGCNAELVEAKKLGKEVFWSSSALENLRQWAEREGARDARAEPETLTHEELEEMVGRSEPEPPEMECVGIRELYEKVRDGLDHLKATVEAAEKAERETTELGEEVERLKVVEERFGLAVLSIGEYVGPGAPYERLLRLGDSLTVNGPHALAGEIKRLEEANEALLMERAELHEIDLTEGLHRVNGLWMRVVLVGWYECAELESAYQRGKAAKGLVGQKG